VVGFVAAGFAAAMAFGANASGAADVADAFETAGFAAAVGRADTLAAGTVRAPAERVADLAAAAARAPVTARTVAAVAVAAFAEAALTVAALAVAALAEATLPVAAPAALARAAIVPAAAAATLPPTVRRARGAGAGRSVVVWVNRVRCDFRCVGTLFVAFSSTGFRDVPRAVARVEPVPLTGSDPSTRRWSWWSGLMHLTSVGGHCRGAPGERSGTYVNTP
jgi:hypothetical protein